MKATITSTLAAGVLSLGGLAMLGGEALAQIKPDAARPEAGAPHYLRQIWPPTSPPPTGPTSPIWHR